MLSITFYFSAIRSCQNPIRLLIMIRKEMTRKSLISNIKKRDAATAYCSGALRKVHLLSAPKRA